MLLCIEGFESFGTTLGAVPSPTGVVTRKYPLTGRENYMDVVSGRLGGYALRLVYDNTCRISPGNITTDATLVIGFALYFASAYPSGSYKRFLAFYDGATQGMNLELNSDGTITVRRGTTDLATTAESVISLGQWHYLEFKVVCNDSTGSYDVRIGGASVLSASGIDTKAGANNYHTTFRVCGTHTSIPSAICVDDLYCLDGSGSINNDFLGNMRVVVLRPDAAGDSAQWTPSAGNNYECVDEVIANDDTDYVEEDTSTEKDLYNYGSLSGIVSDIKGVQISTDCRETDATSFSLKTLVKSGATESADGGQAIGGVDYTTLLRVVELDPDTVAAWTVIGLNAAQFGIEVG